MKKYLGILVVVALVASPALGDLTAQVMMGTSGGAWPSSPYIATVTSGTVGIHTAGTSNASFQTFCLEYSEYFSSPTPYYASVAPYAINGGPDAGDDGIPNQDPVSEETAYLYKQWLAGNQMGYNAVEFQYAIWYLEDELLSTQVGDRSLVLANYAKSQVANGDYLSGIAVMNLFTDAQGRNAAQSQLVSVPVPGAALLVAIGLGLIGWAKRRLA